MNFDIAILTASIVSMLVITTPFDPTKILFFNQAISDPVRNRSTAAAGVALRIVIVLGGAALVGREALDLLGIDLNAFRVAGGLIIALMGFEMLYGGGASKAQGEQHRKDGPDEDDTLLVPLTLPLIAGPGAITTTITIASRGGTDGVIIAFAGVGAVAVAAFVSYAWLGDVISKATPSTVSLLARIGGLILATIGIQMLLGGVKDFFA